MHIYIYNYILVGALTFETSSEVTKRLHHINFLFFKVMTPKGDFLLIGAGTITPKRSMNMANFGKYSLFVE